MSPLERQAQEADSAAKMFSAEEEMCKECEEASRNPPREPNSGALYEDTRVYIRNEGEEEWKFWGVMEDEMMMGQF